MHAQGRAVCAINVTAAASATPATVSSEESGTTVARDPYDHRITIDSDGISVSKDIHDQLADMFHHIELTGRRRLVLFIHGGLTPLTSADQNAKLRGPEIAHDDLNAYPLFLNWEAGLTSSYGRHLAYERNGISYRGTPSAWSAALITPLVFLSDVGRSVANHSMNTVLNFSKVLENNDYWYQTHPAAFVTKNKFLETLREFTQHPDKSQADDKFFHAGFQYGLLRNGPPFKLYLGPDIAHVDAGQFALGSTTIPLQVATEPVLDTVEPPPGKTCYAGPAPCSFQPRILLLPMVRSQKISHRIGHRRRSSQEQPTNSLNNSISF